MYSPTKINNTCINCVRASNLFIATAFDSIISSYICFRPLATIINHSYSILYVIFCLYTLPLLLLLNTAVRCCCCCTFYGESWFASRYGGCECVCVTHVCAIIFNPGFSYDSRNYIDFSVLKKKKERERETRLNIQNNKSKSWSLLLSISVVFLQSIKILSINFTKQKRKSLRKPFDVCVNTS